MTEIPEDIHIAATELFRKYGMTPTEEIAKLILAERKKISNAALKHLIDLVECLDWWRDDPHNREFPCDELIDAREFIASLAPKEA